MPQMFPMNWLMLLILFLIALTFSFMLLNSLIFYCYKQNDNLKIKLTSNIWQW